MTTNQVFHNFALFDGLSPDLQSDCWLEVVDGRIQRIGGRLCPQTEAMVDLGGRTVIPGLIDAHVHLGISFTTKLNLASMLSFTPQIKLNLANCIRNGVTTVRDMGCTPGFIRRMKSWIKRGKTIGPRIICANSFILPPGGTPEQLPTIPFPIHLITGGQIVERVSTPDEVRSAVRRVIAQGADWIKTTHTDKSYWLNRPDPPVFDDACFEALVDEARKHNRPVAMHHTGASGFRKAVELGVDSMEHIPLDAITDDDIKRMVDADVPIVPTLYVMQAELPDWLETEGKVYLCPESLRQTRALLETWKVGFTEEMIEKEWCFNMEKVKRQLPVGRENLRKICSAGATIGIGTDSGGMPYGVFGRFFEECDRMLQMGVSPYDVLHSATAVNARILRLEDKLGTLEPGKLSDFVVVDGNPLQDMTALRRIRMVVKEGAIVHREGM